MNAKLKNNLTIIFCKKKKKILMYTSVKTMSSLHLKRLFSFSIFFHKHERKYSPRLHNNLSTF